MLVYILDDMRINAFFGLWVFEMTRKSVHLYTCGYLRLSNGLQVCRCICIYISMLDDTNVISEL